jgi:hypothetical protein
LFEEFAKLGLAGEQLIHSMKGLVACGVHPRSLCLNSRFPNLSLQMAIVEDSEKGSGKVTINQRFAAHLEGMFGFIFVSGRIWRFL